MINLRRLVLIAVALALACLRGWGVEVPRGFVAETIATGLNAATAIAPAPDGRIFLADQTGRLLVWKDGRVLPNPALVLHVTDYWERGLIGVALDPQFPNPPHLFALYVTDQPVVHHVLSRFTLGGDSVIPGSETVLFEGDDQSKLGGVVPAGHQGGKLCFGGDGHLYISLGEQTAGEPSQRLDTLQGKILRLNRDGSIPSDNPFQAQTTGKYEAIDARGVRNSFGIGAQSLADGGRVFFTDVGGSAFEEVNELVAGANYGWPHAEGYSTNTAYRNPLYAYPPMVGASVVGGAFAPKTRTAAEKFEWPGRWRGQFFFADFMKHWVKALDPVNPTNVTTFARGFNGPVALEIAPDGSMLVLNRGTVWRDPKKFVDNAGSLVRIRYVGAEAAAESGRAHVPAADFTPAIGLPVDPARLPHTISAAEWRQWMQAADSRSVEVIDAQWNPHVATSGRLFLTATGQVRVNGSGELSFPPGSVFVREAFTLSLRSAGDSAPVRRAVERRIIMIGSPTGYGVSYRIDPNGTATLVEDDDVASLGWVRTPGAANARNILANWWYPSPDVALTEPVVNPAYRHITTAAELSSAEASSSALAELQRRGWVEMDASAAPRGFGPGAAQWSDSAANPEARVRAYLHANCAVCHQPGGASRGQFDARLTTPLEQTGLLNGLPVAGDLGIADARLVVPGDPGKSLLVARLKDTGFFRMPPVQYHNESSPIIPVLEQWIRSLATTSQPPPR